METMKLQKRASVSAMLDPKIVVHSTDATDFGDVPDLAEGFTM